MMNEPPKTLVQYACGCQDLMVIGKDVNVIVVHLRPDIHPPVPGQLPELGDGIPRVAFERIAPLIFLERVERPPRHWLHIRGKSSLGPRELEIIGRYLGKAAADACLKATWIPQCVEARIMEAQHQAQG